MTADGSVACCMRVESGKPLRNGGWLHRLRDSDDWHTRRRTRWATVRTQQEPTVNFAELAERYTAAVNPIDLIRLAASLGVSRDSLCRLGIGWDGKAWVFPMKDATGHVVGIRRRFPDGRKLSAKGGHEGLFIPTDLPSDGPLLICEGPTDAAALLGVPVAWLRAEALAARVPYLRVGRRLLFNPAAVEAALLDRAAQEAKGSARVHE